MNPSTQSPQIMNPNSPNCLVSLLPTGRNRLLPASQLTRILPLALGLSAAALTSPVALADATWVGDSSQDWNAVANWSTDPVAPTGHLIVNLATAGVFPKLTSNMTLMPVDLKIGTAGATGRLDQTGGTAATGNGNWMFVGQGTGGNGTYNLADPGTGGGSVTNPGPLTGMGVSAGSINVGGTSTTGGRLIVGDGGNSVGVVNMNTSGTLKMEADDIALILGNAGTSNGTLKLDGGTVQLNAAATGISMLVATNGGDGTFSMSDGTVNATGGVWVGDNAAGSDGVVNITGGTFNATASSAVGSNAAGQMFIGRGLGKGSFTVGGTAAVTFTGGTNIGFSNTATAGTTGTLAVTGGTFNSVGEIRVGSGQVTNTIVAAGAGTFNVSGGTANVTGLTLARGADAGDVVTGSSTISGGVLNVGTNLFLGYAGNANLAQMTISGGTANVGTTATSTLEMSTYDTSKSQLDITSGSVNLFNNSSLKCITGNTGTSGSAVVNQSGGAVTFYSNAGTTVGGTGVLDLAVSGSATSSSTYNLNGGTLTVPSVTVTNPTVGTRLFNFNGGTLKAAKAGTLMNLGSSSATMRANVRDGGAIIDTNSFNVSIPQALVLSNVSGDTLSGGLTKLGAGTLTLSSFGNTYTGTTNVDAGTLDLQGVLASNVVVKSGSTLTGSGSTSGSLTMQGGSTFNFAPAAFYPLAASGGVSFTGPTSLKFIGTPSGGVPYVLFSYGSGGVTGLGNLTSSGYRANIVDDSGMQQVTATVNTGNLSWNSTNGTWAVGTGGWIGGFSNYFNGDSVTFNERSSASVVTLSGSLLPASVTVDNSSNPYTFSGSGSIGGDASLTKSGAGALTLATANTYTGGTTFNAGTLNLNNASALGSGLLTINGGTLDNTSGGPIVMTGAFPQKWNVDVNFTGSNSLDMGTGDVTLASLVVGETDRTVTVAANTLGVGEIKSSALGLIKQGPGTLVVASTGAQPNGSAITGTLNVAAGTLQISRSGTDGANSGDFSATAITGTGTITNGAAVERWLFINTTGANTFSGTLANGGAGGLGFDKQGAGSVTLNGTLSYTGTTTVDAGTLTIPVANTGTGTGAVVNGGFLVLGNPAALGTPAVPATPNIIRVGGTATLDLAHDGGGPTYGFASNTAANAVIIANRGTAGAGITHNLTTVGNAGVSGGTLTFNSGANATSGTSRVSFAQLGLAADTVQTTILNPTNADPAAMGVTIGAVTKVAGTTTQTVELGGTTTDNQITGLISNGTATGGTNLGVALVKTNSSTWTISGANNTYTGGTKIGAANGAGVLRVTASGALGTGTIVFDNSGGNPGPTSRLELASGTGITLANAITLHQRNGTSAAILNASGTNVLSGAIDLNNGGNRANIQSDAGLLTLSGPILTTTAVARNLYLGGAGNGVASGSISNGTGTVNVIKEGAGIWSLTSASNIYTGTTTVAGGTLTMSNATLSDTAAVSVAATATLNLTHNGTDTVDRFFINGVEQVAGIWGSMTSSAAHKTERITGTGLIKATNGATPPAGFSSWATQLGLTTENGAGDNPDKDGFDNGIEYILGGHPKDGSNNPKVYTMIADSNDAGTANELVMTIAVPQGTPPFTPGTVGAPSATATFENFGITVRGSTDLASFPVIVTPVTAIVPAGAPNPLVQGGITYEYRTFSLEGSNGLAGKGFLQVTVTNPAP